MIISESIIFLGIFIAVAVVGIFIVRQFAISGLKRFELIISYLGGVSALLITFNIYITIQSNNRVERNRTAYNTVKNIRNSYIAPQKEIIDAYPEGFFLYASMYQDTDLAKHKPEKYNEAKREQDEIYFSLRIFQAMEDFLSTAQFDITGMKSWLNSYLMWMQSPILQKHWELLKFNYADDTRDLVDRLIDKANGLILLRQQKGALTTHDYDVISKDFKINYRK